MINIPTEGIATDAAHSSKNRITEFQGIDLRTGKRIFYQNLGNKTVNIGEFLGVVEAAKYIIENNYSPRVIYTDSITALTWFRNKKTASKRNARTFKKQKSSLKHWLGTLILLKYVTGIIELGEKHLLILGINKNH